MLHLGRNVSALLLTAAWFVSSNASAQAHGPPAQELKDEVDESDPAWRAARLAEMDVWLRRLAGRFRDSKNTVNYEGEKADCKGIGTGAGMQCFSTMRSSSFSAEKEFRPGNPSIEAKLFGLDTAALRVNYLLVNNKGLPEGGLGRLSGDTLHLRFDCKIPQNSEKIISCQNNLRIYAPPNSKEVTWSTETILLVRTPRGSTEVRYDDDRWLVRMPDSDSASADTGQEPSQVN